MHISGNAIQRKRGIIAQITGQITTGQATGVIAGSAQRRLLAKRTIARFQLQDSFKNF